NSKDLYQRAKYPSWFNPPDDVSAAIPPIKQITNVNGHVFDSTEFTGRLQLPADQPLPGCSAIVELGPIFEALETGKYDAVLTIRHAHCDQPARGALTVKVHRGKKVVASVDAGASLAEVEVPLHAVTAATELSVSLTAQSVEPTGAIAIVSRPVFKNSVGILWASVTRLTWVRLYARGFFLSPTSITFLEELDHYRCIELTDYRLYADTITEIGIARDGDDWLV